MGPVAALLAMDRTTLTAALKPLQRRGLVEIIPDPNDRRGKRIKLTPAGMALLVQATPIWESTSKEVEALLPEGDAERLRKNLLAIS